MKVGKYMQDKRIQWHPAFCSAMRLELKDNKNELDYYNEYNLSSKPLQMDLLVVRRYGTDELCNAIGKIFLTHNIMEYKSPDDGIDIDSYFKTLSYACLYKASGKEVDSIKPDDITITIVQEHKPKKLLNKLNEQGYMISKPYHGIYYIKGNHILFPTQFIVLKELDKEQHVWLTALTSNMTGSDAHRLITKTNQLLHKEDKENADSILNVTIRANVETFSILRKEAPDMCEALEELMEPVIAEKLKRRTEEVTQQVTMAMSNNFAVKLLEDDMPIELIMKYTGLNEEEIKKLRESL